MNEAMRDRRDVDTMRRGNGGEEAREEGAVSGRHTTWWRWREVMSRGSDQRTQGEITHDADAGPRSEIGKIGSQRSFLRATHVPSLHWRVGSISQN